MITHYTLRLNTINDFKEIKQYIKDYSSSNEKLKEYYFDHTKTIEDLLKEIISLTSIPFKVQGIQKINEFQSILFIIENNEELTYKTIEVNASSLEDYEIKEEQSLILLLDKKPIIYK